MEVKAVAKYIKVQPLKVRIIADEVRGTNALHTASLLRYHTSKSAHALHKVLVSAIANAQENHNLPAENLRISTIFVDEGPRLKRMQARAMGRGNRIIKKTSHITVVVEDYEIDRPIKPHGTKPKPRRTLKKVPSSLNKGPSLTEEQLLSRAPMGTTVLDYESKTLGQLVSPEGKSSHAEDSSVNSESSVESPPSPIAEVRRVVNAKFRTENSTGLIVNQAAELLLNIGKKGGLKTKKALGKGIGDDGARLLVSVDSDTCSFNEQSMEMVLPLSGDSPVLVFGFTPMSKGDAVIHVIVSHEKSLKLLQHVVLRGEVIEAT